MHRGTIMSDRVTTSITCPKHRVCDANEKKQRGVSGQIHNQWLKCVSA